MTSPINRPHKPENLTLKLVQRSWACQRHEWLNQHLFASIEQAQETATRWLWSYNNERPNMAIGGITPRQML